MPGRQRIQRRATTAGPHRAAGAAGRSGAARAVTIVAVLIIAGLAVSEYAVNRHGPGRPPDDASVRAGRELLAKVLLSHNAAAWTGRDTVLIRINVHSIRHPTRLVDMTLAVQDRSALFRVQDDPGILYRLDGRTEAITPQHARLTGELETLGPSLVWWTMIPHNLDDPKAVVWRVADRGAQRSPDGSNAPVPRLAVRWPGQVEWFVFDLDSGDFSIRSVEFVDERFTAFFRWKGIYEGRSETGGLTLPGRWRFVPARAMLRAISGGRDLVVLEYGGRP